MQAKRVVYLPLALLTVAAAVVVTAGRADASRPCPDLDGDGFPDFDASGGSCHGLPGGTPGGSGGGGGGGGGGGSGGGSGGGGGGGGGGDVEPEPPSPEDIARAARDRLTMLVSTFLPQPQVTTYPGEGRASIIDIPTFFAVDNWLPPQTDRVTDPATGYYIQVTATPSLSVDPGEPGAPIIRCEDGGTRFDPEGPSPEQQAARPGACAYTYTRRTGTVGRPDQWTARVMVSWTLEWSTNLIVPLPADLATSDLLTETVERPVDEVTTVVNRRD